MAYFYIDDGYPESADYENNYIYFNAEDPECVQKMIQLAQALGSAPAQMKKLFVENFLGRENRGFSERQFC